MTTALEKAFTKASHLPQSVQDQLAEQLMDDMEGESQWDRTLARSQELLENLASNARKAQQRGKTVTRGFDEL